MTLEHPDLPAFEPTLRRLIQLAFDPPALFPKTALLAARWAPDRLRRQAIVETLAGYRDVHAAVATEVVALETEARTLTATMRLARSSRDAAAAHRSADKVEVIRSRQLILRRILDAIVYVVCEQYVVFLRRLALRDDTRPVDADVVTRMVTTASQLSARDPYTVYVAADLTTSVQIGDLIEISTDPSLRWRVRIVEVKEGELNRIIAEYLAAGHSIGDVGQLMGRAAERQAARMLRQRQRLDGVSNFVRSGQGMDPRTGQMLRRTPDAPPTPGYQSELQQLIERARRDGQHLITIDDCLVLAAIRSELLPDPQQGSATHALFHRSHPEVPCLLGSAHAEHELSQLTAEPAIDLVEHSFLATWGFPVYGYGTLDEVCDLFCGRLKVYAKFDAAAFMKRGERLGMRMRWVTGRRAEMLRQSGTTRTIPGSPRATAILVQLRDGAEFELLSGGLARIFLELARPDTLLRRLSRSGPDLRAEPV